VDDKITVKVEVSDGNVVQPASGQALLCIVLDSTDTGESVRNEFSTMAIGNIDELIDMIVNAIEYIEVELPPEGAVIFRPQLMARLRQANPMLGFIKA